MHVAERPKESKIVDVAGLIDKGVVFDLRTSEAPEERASRLRREEVEADHKLRAQKTEEAHKRLIVLTLHIFVMSIVASLSWQVPILRWLGTRRPACRTRRWASSRPSSRVGPAT
jgi:hypothetical protein